VTEAEWLRSTDPDALLHYLRGKASDRQFRLFACACCRRIWHLLRDKRSREAVETTEWFADGQTDRQTLHEAREAGEQVIGRFAARDGQADALAASVAAVLLAEANVARGAAQVAERAAEAVSYYAVRQRSWPDLGSAKQARLAAKGAEREVQADLLRHIIGNPFRPVPTFRPWSSTVVALAQALYRGEDCLFALHDALLDEGATDLAFHFGQPEHPKGCWLLDMLRSPLSEPGTTAGEPGA
jgi:hypothetical protein